MKNIVFDRILHIRSEKLKPRLRDVLQKVQEQGLSGNKEYIRQRLVLLYTFNVNEILKKEPPKENVKFSKLTHGFGRLVKAMDHQNDSLSEVDKRLTNLLLRR